MAYTNDTMNNNGLIAHKTPAKAKMDNRLFIIIKMKESADWVRARISSEIR